MYLGMHNRKVWHSEKVLSMSWCSMHLCNNQDKLYIFYDVQNAYTDWIIMHSSSKRDTELKLFSKTQFIYTHTHKPFF